MAVEKVGSSKTDVIVKLVLVFFMSLLSFTIGTYVGKKFSDNQHKLAEMEPTAAGSEAKEESSSESREVASVSSEAAEVKPKDALNDEEIKKLAEEFVADEKGEKKAEVKEGSPEKEEKTTASHEESHKGGTEKAEKAHSHEAEKAHAHEAEKSAVHEAEKKPEILKKAHDETPATAHMPAATAYAKKIAENKGGEPEASETKVQNNRLPQSLPKELSSSALGKYTVQVAAYPTESEAGKMANDLKGKGFSAFYVSAKIKDRTWYRVSVGIFATAKEAEAYKSDLLARAKVGSALVQQITK